ncbi:hypothetical protein KY360_03405 [Candidatus Woesearchaeota archaeon]|nr:hypothetical protein [Candidatus Woesearchaeota archaeon]
MKKILTISLIVLALVLAGCGESPEGAQAKTELAAIDGQIAALQAKVSAIPALELSDEVEDDLAIQIHYLGILATVIPNVRENPAFMAEVMAFRTAVSKRDRVSFDRPEEDPMSAVTLVSEDMAPVIDEDLEELSKLADKFESAVELANAGIEEIPDLTVERTSKVEKFFTEHAKKKAQYEALAASIPESSTDDFRAKVEELKKANTVFKQTIAELKSTDDGMIVALTPQLKEFSPDAYATAEKIMACRTPSEDPDFCQSENSWTGLYDVYFGYIHEAFKALRG